MNVLIDTSVWSLALRRRAGDLSTGQKAIVRELAGLIEEGRAHLAGLVRLELLSGIKEVRQFERLRADLRAFDDVPLVIDDHEEAALACNRCRVRGIAGSPVDFLLCAIAMRRDWTLFTTDTDFSRYAKHVPVRLHRARRMD